MNLTRARWLVTGVYIITLAICVVTGIILGPMNMILKALILDIIGTAIIFLFSLTFNNSSMYDAYWSVAPIPILVYWMWLSPGEADIIRQVIIIGMVSIWGYRLTYNWAKRWKGMKDEDWRYVNFRNQFGKWYWPISFLGIHLFPTLIVFAALIPLYFAMHSVAPPGIFDFLALVVTGCAILIEWKADRELRFYLRNNGGHPFLKTGLWKYSRHPNYFGEVLFWIGLFLFSLSHTPFVWWTVPGPVLMTLLFYFISIPMIDKRMLSRKQGYAEYMASTSGLIPWP